MVDARDRDRYFGPRPPANEVARSLLATQRAKVDETGQQVKQTWSRGMGMVRAKVDEWGTGDVR
jgi:hypothetical protein